MTFEVGCKFDFLATHATADGWWVKGYLLPALALPDTRHQALLRLGISRQAQATTSGAVQIAKASPANATATRRLIGASTASS
jgi:hypothetical protein